MTTQPHGSGFTNYEQKRWGSNASMANVDSQTERYAQAIAPGLVRDATTIGAASASAGVSRSGDGHGLCERDDNSYDQSNVYSSMRNGQRSNPAFRAHEDATSGATTSVMTEAIQSLLEAQIKMTDALTDFSR